SMTREPGWYAAARPPRLRSAGVNPWSLAASMAVAKPGRNRSRAPKAKVGAGRYIRSVAPLRPALTESRGMRAKASSSTGPSPWAATEVIAVLTVCTRTRVEDVGVRSRFGLSEIAPGSKRYVSRDRLSRVVSMLTTTGHRLPGAPGRIVTETAAWGAMIVLVSMSYVVSGTSGCLASGGGPAIIAAAEIISAGGFDNRMGSLSLLIVVALSCAALFIPSKVHATRPPAVRKASLSIPAIIEAALLIVLTLPPS